MPNFNLAGEESFNSGNRKSSDATSEKHILNIRKPLPDEPVVASQKKKEEIKQRAVKASGASHIDLSPHHPLEHSETDVIKREPTSREKKSEVFTNIPDLFRVEIPFPTVESIREEKKTASTKNPVADSPTEISNTSTKTPQKKIEQSQEIEKTINLPSITSPSQNEPIIPNEVSPQSERIPEFKHTHSALSYILIFLILLCAAVMTYYLGFIPAYTRFVDHTLGRTEGIPPNQTKESFIIKSVATPQQTPQAPLLKYDYFIQVSSWEQQYLAEREKEKFQMKKLPSLVVSDFIAKRKRTFYRVRLGPFHSKTEAQKIKTQYAGMIPSDAFVDSTISYEKDSTLSQASLSQKTNLKDDRKTSTGMQRDQPKIESQSKKEMQQNVHPAMRSGYVVAVSSFKQKSLADQEAKKLLAKGYSAFIQQSQTGASLWYRVQVGPFKTQDDAKRYLQLIRATDGNDAYIIDLSLE